MTKAAPVKQSKVGLVLEMLQREQGATLDELTKATEWLPHTTRAALTGLRKKDHKIEKTKRDDAHLLSSERECLIVGKLLAQMDELAAMSPAQLLASWQTRSDQPASRLPADIIRLALAYRVQERALGGLPAKAARELRHCTRSPSAEPLPRSASVSPGTRLMREWNGTVIEVEATNDGFRYDGQVYRSLTAIARLITGARWSGPRFFGLTKNV